MPVSDSFHEYVAEQLSRVTPVTTRSMFGGAGIYAQGTFFALMADDTLYFEVDDGSRLDYESAGMEPFRPFGPEGAAMQYYAVPRDFLDDVEALAGRRDKAIAFADRKRSKRR